MFVVTPAPESDNYNKYLHEQSARGGHDTVIQTYDNVKFGDSRPLTDLLDLLASERKHDEIRSYGALKLTDDLALVEGGATFTKRGFNALCRLTSMPPVMVDWLSRNDYKPELARFINSELVGLEFDDEQNNRPRKRVFTRFRESNDGSQLCCRALFSDRYAVCDANILIAMISDALTASERAEARVHRLSYDGDELLCNLVWPGCDRQVGGESFQVGIAIQTSEVGTLRMQIMPWIGRLVCGNGLVVNTPTGQAVSKRHIGKIDLNQLAAGIRATVGSALAQSERALMQLEGGRKVELASAERIIIQLGRDHRLTFEQVKGWLRGHEATLSEPTVGAASAFSIINGLTRSAQETELAVEMTQLESLAGELVAPRFDALYGEIEAEWRRIETRASMLSDEVMATYLG